MSIAPHISRRDLLRGALALGFTRVVPGTLSGCAPSASGASWGELAAMLSGRVLVPSDMSFAEAVRPWNLRFASRVPGAIAQCANADDVQKAVRWATARSVPIVARSGGHSYGAFSTTTPDGLLISVAPMNSVSPPTSEGRIELGGGVRNTNVYSMVAPMNVAVTHGRCYQVGVAGLVMGGGIGFNMRFHGLTCDQLVETDVVLATGEKVTCNAATNPDLFWALRGGGGGNFGINTRFVFQTYPVGPLARFKIEWEGMPEAVLSRAVAAMERAGDALGVKLSITASGSPLTLKTLLLGQLIGTADEVRALFADVIAARAPSVQEISVQPYWDAQNMLSDQGVPEYMHERSRYFTGRFSDAAIALVLERMRAFPGTGGSVAWKIFLTGGQVARVAPDATAYVHRNASGLSTIELTWLESDSEAQTRAAQEWLSSFHDALEPHTSNFAYQNFIDPDQRDHLNAYYGANLARLVDVKRRYDPSNVFRYAQSIPTSMPTG